MKDKNTLKNSQHVCLGKDNGNFISVSPHLNSRQCAVVMKASPSLFFTTQVKLKPVEFVNIALNVNNNMLFSSVCSGPLLALALAREEAVSNWREMLGPKEVDKAKEEAPESLRAQFSVEECPINQLHGSDTPETAEQELNFFFPMQQTVAVVKPDAYQTKGNIILPWNLEKEK